MNKFPTENNQFLGLIVDHKLDSKNRICYKVRVPSLHYQDVSDDDLPWVYAEAQPSLLGLTTSGGAMDRGQIVYIQKLAGEGGSGLGKIISTVHNMGSS